MMMADKGKKGIAIILSKMKGGEEEMKKAPMSEEGAESDHEMGLTSAAEEILRAVKSDNPKALVEAMKAFYDMCGSEEEDMERSNPEMEEKSEY
jgi:hypothetical protein